MKLFLHGFRLIDGIQYKSFRQLNEFFDGDFERAWHADVPLLRRAGLTEHLTQKIVIGRRAISLTRESDELKRNGVVLVTPGDEEFPHILNEIADRPFLFYRRGRALGKQFNGVSIVGTRVPSAYGETVAAELSESLCERGATVVSGLAYGIDSIAHAVAVRMNQPTVAVLASGVLRVTPSVHDSLAREILRTGGTLISEYAHFDSAHKYRFLERNRIIAGLSRATIVIEAKARSGALITAHHAFDQDRDIYALVGDINRVQARGCLDLIEKDQAQPITSITHLCEQLGLDNALMFGDTEGGAKGKELDARHVSGLLSKRPLSTSELIASTGWPIERVLLSLSFLEMRAQAAPSGSRWKLTRTSP